MYYRGRGVAEDKGKAGYWFRRAADQGNAAAQHNLANSLYFGDGAEINYPEAFKLYQRAAAQGYADSQYNLGVMYEKGQGVPKDLSKAYFWWLLASAHGVADAEKNKGRLERLLTAEQRAQGQAEASQWKPTVQTESRSRPDTGAERVAARSDTGEANSTGTAFRVSANRYVARFQAVHGCHKLRVNGSESAQAQASDEKNDLALLSVSAANGATAVIRIGRVRLGEQVFAAAFSPGAAASDLKVASGSVSALTGLQGDTRFLQISGPSQPPGSGPVFDASGNIVGFVEDKLDVMSQAQAGGDVPREANFATTSNMLQGFLNAHDIEFDTAGLGIAAPAQVAIKARDVVALVECWR
jgi:S1-C subfamily serine protease